MDDLKLTRPLGTVTKGAGFEPYLQMDESRPGQDMWEIIEPRIIESAAIALIWTDRTDWANGVEKEIELAKENNILYAPLIEEPLPVPPHFRHSPIEYVHFDSEGHLGTFSNTVSGLRSAVIKTKK